MNSIEVRVRELAISAFNFAVLKTRKSLSSLIGSVDVRESTVTIDTHDWELICFHIQSLLLWENPVRSIVAFGMVNLAFWILVSTRQFLSIVFIVLFSGTFATIWKTRIWPEIRVPPTDEQMERQDWTPVSPNAMTLTEIQNSMQNLKDFFKRVSFRLVSLRKDHHGIFCVLTTTIFLVTALVGHFISGIVIVYSILLLVTLTPGIVTHFVPSNLMSILTSNSDIPQSTMPTELEVTQELTKGSVLSSVIDTTVESESSLLGHDPRSSSSRSASVNSLDQTSDDDQFEMIQSSELET